MGVCFGQNVTCALLLTLVVSYDWLPLRGNNYHKRVTCRLAVYELGVGRLIFFTLLLAYELVLCLENVVQVPWFRQFGIMCSTLQKDVYRLSISTCRRVEKTALQAWATLLTYPNTCQRPVPGDVVRGFLVRYLPIQQCSAQSNYKATPRPCVCPLATVAPQSAPSGDPCT